MVGLLLLAIDLQSSCASKPCWGLQQSLHKRCIACRVCKGHPGVPGWGLQQRMETGNRANDSPLLRSPQPSTVFSCWFSNRCKQKCFSSWWMCAHVCFIHASRLARLSQNTTALIAFKLHAAAFWAAQSWTAQCSVLRINKQDFTNLL